jgi:hypothetical protein
MPFAGGKIAPALLVPPPDNQISELPGATLSLTAFAPSFDVPESFAINPIILRDATYTYTGSAAVRKQFGFRPGDSALIETIPPNNNVTIDTTPLQFHEDRPLSLPLPPEGAGHAWYVRTSQNLGPDTWEFDPPTVGVWQQLNTTRSWFIARGPSPSVTENTGIFEVAVFDSVPNFVKLYARARITVRYTRP